MEQLVERSVGRWDLLDGLCARLNLGWCVGGRCALPGCSRGRRLILFPPYINDPRWSYEWCHHKEIRQFHQEGSEITSDWSLGQFVRSTEPGDISDRDVGMVHYFEVFSHSSTLAHDPCFLVHTLVRFVFTPSEWPELRRDGEK